MLAPGINHENTTARTAISQDYSMLTSVNIVLKPIHGKQAII